jgi:mannosyltransferase
MSPTPAGGNDAAGTGAAAAVRATDPAPAPAAVADSGQAPRAGDASRGLAARAATYAAILCPAAVMLVFGLWGLTRDSSMGNDEVATRWAALLSLRELAHLLSNVDAVHGLYYLIMHAWVAVGSSPTALRVPSVIAMTVAAALVAVLARRLTGSPWPALFAGIFMALTPTISYYAQTARSYAMVLACVVAMTIVLVRALDVEAAGGDPRQVRRWWIGYAALVTLSSYLNEMALLVLAAHAVTVLVARPGRRVFERWFTSGAIGAVLVLPLLALSVKERGAIGWIPRPGLNALRILFHDYFGATDVVALLLLACAVVAVLPERAARRAPSPATAPDGATTSTAPDGATTTPWWRGGVSLPSVAAPLLVIPAFLLLAESRVLHPLYADRYVLYGEAGAALLAGAGAYRAGQWAARLLSLPGGRRTLVCLPGVAACVLAFVLQLTPDHSVRTPQSRAYDFGGPSRYIGAHAHRGDGILYFDTFYRKAELGYPWDFTKVTDFADAETPMQAGTFRGTDKTYAQTLPLMLRYQRIWVVGELPSATLPTALLRGESETLATRFTMIDVQYFKGITVTLWRRR